MKMFFSKLELIFNTWNFQRSVKDQGYSRSEIKDMYSKTKK